MIVVGVSHKLVTSTAIEANLADYSKKRYSWISNLIRRASLSWSRPRFIKWCEISTLPLHKNKGSTNLVVGGQDLIGDFCHWIDEWYLTYFMVASSLVAFATGSSRRVSLAIHEFRAVAIPMIVSGLGSKSRRKISWYVPRANFRALTQRADATFEARSFRFWRTNFNASGSSDSYSSSTLEWGESKPWSSLKSKSSSLHPDTDTSGILCYLLKFWATQSQCLREFGVTTYREVKLDPPENINDDSPTFSAPSPEKAANVLLSLEWQCPKIHYYAYIYTYIDMPYVCVLIVLRLQTDC